MGMKGTGDWSDSDFRPKSWREGILFRYPNGSAPLTAIMSKLGSQPVSDPQFYWFTQGLPTQRADVTGVYTDSGLSVAYVSDGKADDTLYVKMSSNDVAQFRYGHQVLLRYASDLTVDVNTVVIGRDDNGASSYIQVKLIEDDDNSSSYDLSDCDVALIVGNLNSEGAAMPDALSYEPTKWSNYTHIWRTSLEITRTQMQTTMRTGDSYKELKRQCLQLHSIEIEKSLLFSVASEKTGDNGKPRRSTMGLIPAIVSGGTVNNYVTNASFAGKTWLQGGEDWLDQQLATIFKYGANEKLCFAGQTALLGLNRLVKAGAIFQFTPATTSYGIRIIQWVTPFGTINIMTHPLFSYEATTSKSMVIFEPKDLKFRYIQDTIFKNDDRLRKGDWTSRDGLKEEYLTEAGLEYHHPNGWGYLYGIGDDNSL
jgi:hypothetical protein